MRRQIDQQMILMELVTQSLRNAQRLFLKPIDSCLSKFIGLTLAFRGATFTVLLEEYMSIFLVI